MGSITATVIMTNSLYELFFLTGEGVPVYTIIFNSVCVCFFYFLFYIYVFQIQMHYVLHALNYNHQTSFYNETTMVTSDSLFRAVTGYEFLSYCF